MALTKLTTYQNNTLSFTALLQDSAGTAINITGATLIVTVYNGNTIVETETITNHTTPLSGISTCTFTYSETALWPVTLLGYELQWTLASGTRYSFSGDLEVIKDK